MTEPKSAADLAGTRWAPEQYLKFAGPRLRPALDLLARVDLEAPGLVADLGCGTGEITRMLAARWPGARVTGLDSSSEMLAKAGAEPGPVAWTKGDIAAWKPAEPVHLIYSNAALHWLPGHAALFPRLAGFLAPGGCLAVQMPMSWPLRSHRILREVLAGGGPGGRPFGDETLREAMERRPVLDPSAYFDLLAGRTARLDIWETEYLQALEGDDPVLEWVRGTTLRPVLNALGDDDPAAFLAEYGRRLREAYPRRPDGRTLYPFRRLFVVAHA